MIDYITNITATGNGILMAIGGLFTVVALLSLAFVCVYAFFSPEARKTAWLSRLGLILLACSIFGCSSMLVTWGLQLGS
jgi:hypothetical protein